LSLGAADLTGKRIGDGGECSEGDDAVAVPRHGRDGGGSGRRG